MMMPRFAGPSSSALLALVFVATSIVATFSLGSSTLAEQSGGWREHCHGTGSCRASTPRASVHSFMPQTTTQVFFVSTSSNLQGGYDVEADYLYINDVASQIPDIATIHNGRTFEVIQGLVWSEQEFVSNSTNVLLWTMFVDGNEQASGEIDLSASRALPSEINAGTASVSNSGTHTIEVVVSVDDIESGASRDYQSFNKGASFAPLVVVLVFAVTTHMVELSLGLGVFVGACMVSGTITDGFKTTLDTYILEALASVDHGFVYLFALFMSGMVGMLERSGGLIGITDALRRFVRTARSAQLTAFTCGLIIFFDDYANTLVAGASMRPLLDAMCVSREKLAFIVDATAAPIASIVPISSWVGFEVGLIQAELDKILARDPNPSIVTTGFGVFLETIKYRYYCIFMLFLMPMLIIADRDLGPMLIAERRCRIYARTDGGDGAARATGGDEQLKSTNAPTPDTPCRWWNMAFPVLMLIFYIFYLLIVTGDDGSGTQSFLDIMQNADSYSALLWGTMAGALTAWAFYALQDKKGDRIIWFNVKGHVGKLRRWCTSCFQRFRRNESLDEYEEDEGVEEKEHSKPLMNYRDGMDSFLRGLEHIFGALVVLTLAWASGHIMTAVGLDRFFGVLISESNLNYQMLPTISFVVSMVIAFATGTSWGTMTIMFPLMLGPSYDASGGDPVIFYGVTAGILAGAVAGDHASPISDTTVLSSMASQCQVLEHVRTQAPYVLVVVTWSILVGTIPAAGTQAYPNGVAILLGFIFLLLHVIFTAAKVVNKSGRFDCFTALYMWIKKDKDLEFLKQETKRAYAESSEADSSKGLGGFVAAFFKKKNAAGEEDDEVKGLEKDDPAEDVASFDNEEEFDEPAKEKAVEESQADITEDIETP